MKEKLNEMKEKVIDFANTDVGKTILGAAEVTAFLFAGWRIGRQRGQLEGITYVLRTIDSIKIEEVVDNATSIQTF